MERGEHNRRGRQEPAEKRWSSDGGGGRGKGAKKREIGTTRGQEGEGNTWPHPDFTHATARAEEETEREVTATSGHAVHVKRCGSVVTTDS